MMIHLVVSEIGVFIMGSTILEHPVVLAVNNKQLEEFCWRFLFCFENKPVLGETCNQKARLPQFKFNVLFYRQLLKYLSRKNWRVGGG